MTRNTQVQNQLRDAPKTKWHCSGVDAPLKYTNKMATLFSNMSKIAEGELYKDIQEEKREQFSRVSPIKPI